MELIGLNGVKHAGKDSVFKMMQEHLAATYELKASRGAFADKMKIAIVRIFFGDTLTDEECLKAADDLKLKGAGMCANFPTFQGGKTVHVDGRTSLEHFGTESLRHVYGNDFHIDQLLPVGGGYLPQGGGKWMESFPSDTDVAVITDLRFPNEAFRVMQLGGHVWEITRRGFTPGGHSSNQRLPKEMIDCVIPNDAGLAELESTVKSIVDVWMKNPQVAV